MEDDPEDEADWSEDEFDRHVSEVLDSEADFLREQARSLLATGSILITRPRGTLRAWLRVPRWWRRGVLRTEAARMDGGGGGSISQLGRTMDATALVGEITLRLAVEFAWLDEVDE